MGPAAATGRAPRRPTSPALRIWLASVIVLSVAGWAASGGRRLPAPVAATGPDSAFSSARALAQLVEIAQRPHPIGSPDLIRVRSMLVGRLTALGLEPEVQVTTSVVRDSSFVRAATVRNIVARIPGTTSTGAVALTAHYDSAPLSPGAGDNAMGVGMVLETLRTLLSAGPLRNDLIIVLTDGDEVGELGWKAFVEQHPWASDVAVTVNVESRGTSGPAVVFESLHGNGGLVRAFAAADADPNATWLARSLRTSALESMEGEAMPGHQAPSLSVSVLGGRAWEDGSRDVRERVSERTLQHGGQQLLALVRALGGIDLRRELASPDDVLLSLPLAGLVHYRSLWSPLVTAGLLLAWGLIGLVIHLRRGTRNGVLSGLALGGASVGAAAAAGSALLDFLGNLHPEYGLLDTALYRDGPHVLALAMVAVAITSIVYTVAKRWSRWDEMLFGALAVPLAYTVWLTFATPAAAPAIQWPLALALAGALAITLLGPLRGRSAWTWSVILLLAAATVVLAVPSLQLVADAWTLRRAAALGALFGLTSILLLPVMAWLQRPRFWATPLATLAIAAALVALHLPSVQGAVDHPEPTTLVYLTDEPATVDPIFRANATGAGTGATGETGERRMLGQWLTTPGPGEAWARSWVAEPPTGPTDAGTLLIGPDDRYEIAGTAPDTELAPPSVAVVSSSPAGDRQELVLEVRSGLRGEMIGIVVPDGTPAELTGVGSAQWRVGGIPSRQVVHWGVPDGGALRVLLSVERDARRVELLVLEHHLRPTEVLGEDFFERADSIIPNAAAGSDRVIQRTTAVVDVPLGTTLPLAAEEASGGEAPLEAP